MKRKFALLLTAVLLMSAIMSLGSVSAAVTTKMHADFTGMVTNSIPDNETNFGIIFENKGYSTLAPVTGVFGKDESDTSLLMYNDVFTTDTNHNSNSYLDIKSRYKDIKPGDTVNIHFSVAFDDDTNQPITVEVMYFNQDGTDASGKISYFPFQLTSNGAVSCLGSSAGTIPYARNMWYDINLVYTVGKQASAEDEEDVLNKLDLYVNGEKLTTREFDLISSTPELDTIGGIRQIRVHHNFSKITNSDPEAAGGQYTYPERKIYIDDVDFSVYSDSDKPYIPGGISTTDTKFLINLFTKSKIVCLDSGVTVGYLKNALVSDAGYTFAYDYYDETGALVTDDTAVLGNGMLKVTDTSNNYTYFKKVEVVDRFYLANDNFNRAIGTNAGSGSSVGVDRKGHTTYGTYSTEEGAIGLGGKDKTNGAYVIKTENFQSSPSSTNVDPFINYQSSVPFSGIVTFECSVYLEGTDNQINVTIPYSRTEGKVNSDVWYSALRLGSDGLIYSNGKSLDKRYNKGQWYKMSCEMNTETKQSKVYLNGDLIATNTLSDMKAAHRLKAEVRYPKEDAVYNGLAAFDDFKVFYGSYDAEPNIINVASNNTDVISINESLNRMIVYPEPVAMTDAVTSAIDTNAKYSLYDDSTLTSSVMCQTFINDGMYIVFESPNGETYKYYEFIKQSSIIGIKESIYPYSEAAATITVPFGTTAAELLDGVTPYTGCEISLKTAAGEPIADNAYITIGNILVVSKGDSTLEYEVLSGLCVDEDFSGWTVYDPETDSPVYDKSNVKIPAPLALTISNNGTENDENTIVKAYVVNEEVRGNALRIYSNSQIENTVGNRQVTLYYNTPADKFKNTFVFEVDIKPTTQAGETQVLAKYDTTRSDGTNNPENYLHIANFKNGQINGIDVDYNVWHRITGVVDVTNGTLTKYLDGIKYQETDWDTSSFSKFTGLRFQHRMLKNTERVDYCDNFRVYELESINDFNENHMSTMLSSNTLNFRFDTIKPVIKGAVGMTADALNSALIKPDNYTSVTITNADGIELAGSDIVDETTVVKVVSAEGLASVCYSISNEPEIACPVFNMTTLEAGTVTATADITNYTAQPLAAAVIVAVYNNGMLEEITCTEDSITAEGSITASLDIINPVGRTVKAYIVDSLNNIKPLASSNAISYVPPTEE